MKLIQGDCLVEMSSIPDGSVDMILTDPPYGTTACKWDSVIPFEPMWKQLNRIIKKNGAIVLFCNQPFTSYLIISNVKKYRHGWIWNKRSISNHFQAKNAPLKSTEDIIVFGLNRVNYYPQKTDKPKSEQRKCKFNPNYNKGMNKKDGALRGTKTGLAKDHDETKTNPKNIIDIPAVYKKNTIHPTQKPVALMEYLIKTYTNEGETVLDFTMGSGTTGVACKNLNREFIGIELDETYFNIAKERIEQHIVQEKLF